MDSPALFMAQEVSGRLHFCATMVCAPSCKASAPAVQLIAGFPVSSHGANIILFLVIPLDSKLNPVLLKHLLSVSSSR
jgi:hypothetical protein